MCLGVGGMIMVQDHGKTNLPTANSAWNDAWPRIELGLRGVRTIIRKRLFK
jgi:hypothetical protein